MLVLTPTLKALLQDLSTEFDSQLTLLGDAADADSTSDESKAELSTKLRAIPTSAKTKIRAIIEGEVDLDSVCPLTKSLMQLWLNEQSRSVEQAWREYVRRADEQKIAPKNNQVDIENRVIQNAINERMVERKLEDVCSLVELMGVICEDLKESQTKVLELRRTRRGDDIHDQNLLTSIRQNSSDLSSAAIAGRIWVDGLIANLNEKDQLALSPLISKPQDGFPGARNASASEIALIPPEGINGTPSRMGAARTPVRGRNDLERKEQQSNDLGRAEGKVSGSGRKQPGFYQNVTSFVVDDNPRENEVAPPEESLLANHPRPMAARRLRGNIKVDANKALQDCAFLDVDSLGYSGNGEVGRQNPAALFAFGLGCPSIPTQPPDPPAPKATGLPKRRVSISAKFQQTMDRMTQDLRGLEG